MINRNAKILSLAILGHSMSHIYILVITAIFLPLAADFNVSLSKITAAAGICYFLFGVGSLPAGFLTSKKNPKFTLKLFFLLSAIASVFVGLSNSFLAFTVSLAFLGLGSSIYHVAGLTLLSHHAEKKGRSYGFHGIAGSAGISIAPVLSSTVTYFWGWKSLYFLLAIPGIIGFLLLSLDKKIPVKATVKEKRIENNPGNNSLFSLFLIMLTIMTINGFIYRGFLTIFPIHVSGKIIVKNIPELLAGGTLASLILSFGMIGQVIGGYLSDRFDTKLVYLVFISISLPMFFLIAASSNIILMIISCLFVIVYFPLQPIENHIISSYTPQKYVGSIFGLKFILTFGVSSIASYIAGFISEKYNSSYFFVLLAFIGLISIMFTVIFFIKTRLISIKN